MALDRRRILRREDDRQTGLERDDLILLLESYRNTIELNTTLLERQEILLNSVDKIAEQVLKVCANQAAMAAEFARLPASLRTAAENDSEIADAIKDGRTEAIKEHAALTLRIYAAFAVLGGLAIALIGLIVKLWPQIP